MAALLAALVLVHGTVLRGPTKPVCEMATPCSEPAAGVVLVFARGGVKTRARTDAKGRYAIKLRRGTYVVRTAQVATIGRGLEPTTLAVRGPLAANFLIDTGIR